ncbi:hypothetical protein ABEB36_007269 [Hypothenemus hampei]|uniref:UBZ4-type domain-containing protein n=1 Tax=Hypothenemus hampei TaxID=57062 RepID=A0ABD1ETD8_HYPHA
MDQTNKYYYNNFRSYKSLPEKSNMLKVTHREPRYVNIQNSQEYLNADSKTRIEMLHKYHQSQFFREHFTGLSLKDYPYSSLIKVEVRQESPTKNGNEDEDSHQDIVHSMYQTRSGRITKKKEYTEMKLDSDDECPVNNKVPRLDPDFHLNNNSLDSEVEKTVKSSTNDDSECKNEATTRKISTPKGRRSINQQAEESTDQSRKSEKSKAEEKPSKSNMVLCPICSISFPTKEIERHASSCSDEVNVFEEGPFSH